MMLSLQGKAIISEVAVKFIFRRKTRRIFTSVAVISKIFARSTDSINLAALNGGSLQQSVVTSKGNHTGPFEERRVNNNPPVGNFFHSSTALLC